MTVRQRQWLGAVFFALMFGHFCVNAYSSWLSLTRLGGSYDGWGARLLPDGRAEIATVDQNGPAAALRPGDEFISINGLRLKDDPDIRNYNRRVPPGTRYTMVVRRQGQLLEFSLTTTTYPLSRGLIPVADILVQLLFLLTGLVVFLLRPADRQAWLLALLLGSFTGLFNNNLPPLPVALLPMMAVARVIGLWALPLLVHFFLIFPERSPLLGRFPRLERWLYVPFYFILPWFTFTRMIVVFRSQEQIFKNSWLLAHPWVGLLALSVAIGYLIAGLGALLVGYRAAGVTARRKLRVVVAGSGAGFLNLLLLIVWETFFRRRFPQAGDWMEVTLKFTLPLIPLSFAYAIVRHQVIPVSLIIRRGVRYLLVSRGSILLEALVVFVTITALLTYVFNRIKPPGIVIGIVSAAVGILVWRLESWLHNKYLAPVIDRHFFRESYNSHQIIADLTNELRTVTGLPQLLELVSTKILSALKTENVTIFMRDPASGDYLSGYSCEYRVGNGQPVARNTGLKLPHDAGVIGKLADAGTPVEVEGGELLSAKDNGHWPAAIERETLREMNSALLLPLATKDGMVGLVSLGPRLGDLPFSRDDKHLLMSVAGPATFAIENAQLLGRMIEEARRREEIEAENQQRAKELEEARQLQLSMLPKSVPQLPHLEIAAYMKTATEVGGDYYDFHLSSDGTLTVAVGDATGHGLKAGTVVTAMKSLFHCFADEPELPPVMNRSSRVLKQMNLRSLYMGLTVIKLTGRHLKVSSAGMPPMLIYRAEGRAVEEVLIKAMPLGSVSDYTYREQELSVSRGDVVVLMSDGLPERFNPRGELFDYWRATDALAEVAEGSPREIIEHLVRAGEVWAEGRPQDDDVTFVVLKVK